jgi:hypothetical protein
MATRYLVARSLFVALFSALILTASSLPTVNAAGKQEIRFYKINKDGITQRLRFTTRKSRQPGCHNFLKRARLHRAVQFAYSNCRVYQEKDCADSSVMSFTRDKEPEPTTELSQGYGWYPVGEHERGELVRSWYCE